MGSMFSGAVSEPIQVPAQPKIAVDFGGVIVVGDDHRTAGEDTMFGAQYLEAPAVPGVFAALRELTTRFGRNQVIIISKARSRTMKQRTREWLKHNRFYDQTGLLEKNVFFTDTREDKGKVAAKEQVSVMIDDHLDCIEAVQRWVRGARGVLFGTATAADLPRGVQASPTWADVVATLV